MKKYTFSVPGHPVGKQQTRVVQGIFYTRKEVSEYQSKIILHFKIAGYKPIDDRTHRWRLVVMVFYKGRADWDKLGNVVGDTLAAPRNKRGIRQKDARGFLWHDDEQIDDGRVVKMRITKKDYEEHITIIAEQLEAKDG